MKIITIYIFYFFLLFSILGVSHSVFAQNIVEKPIKVEKKKSLNGFEVEMEATSEDTQKALRIAVEKWLDTQKIKYKEKKGNYHAEEVVVKAFSDKTSDLHIFVNEKKGKITIQVVQILGYDLAVNSKDYPQEGQNIRAWLENLVEQVRIEQINIQIAALQKQLKETEKNIEKNEKTDESLKNDIEEYKKKISEAEKNIEKNASEQKENEKKQAALKEKIQQLEKSLNR